MSRRARAAVLLCAAAICALAAAAIAESYGDSVSDQLGELRTVVVAEETVPAKARFDHEAIKSLGVRRVPARFAPPDALPDPAAVAGLVSAVVIPVGGYLTASMLRERRGGPERIQLGEARRPVELEVSSAGTLAGEVNRGRAVDVVVTTEPGIGGQGRTAISARGVPLIALEAGGGGPGSGRSWTATLGLTRPEAIRLIDAESFARQIRLIPSGR